MRGDEDVQKIAKWLENCSDGSGKKNPTVRLMSTGSPGWMWEIVDHPNVPYCSEPASFQKDNVSFTLVEGRIFIDAAQLIDVISAGAAFLSRELDAEVCEVAGFAGPGERKT